MNQKFILNFITPLIAASSIGLLSPSHAANFATFSQTELTISNFSQLPQDVGVIGDVSAISIVETGMVEIQLDGDAIFLRDDSNSIAFGSSRFQTSILGTGVNYLGRTEILSNLIGHFDIPANTIFGFDIKSSVLLRNSTDDLALSPVSSSGNINLILQDVFTQKDWPIFNFSGFLNTNSVDKLSRDLFIFNSSSSLNILEYEEETLFGSNNEALQFSLTASFQIIVNEPTELVLLAATHSCNYGSNLTDVCASVPEPSHILGIFLFAGFIFSMRQRYI